VPISRRKIAAAVLGAALISGAALATLKPNTSGLAVEDVEVTASKLASFDKGGATSSGLGKLEWRSGVVLTSPSRSFGGWSGLALDPDGKKLIAISDAGTWMIADIVTADGRLDGLTKARIGPLKSPEGEPLSKSSDRDSEGVALADGNLAQGSLLIPFEHNSRIGRFAIDKGEVSPPSAFLEMPPEAEGMGNDGFEAVTVLRGGALKGSILAIAESPVSGEKEHTGWLWPSDGKGPKRFTLAGIGDYGVTDAASLSDGSVLILERRYRPIDGVRMRLRKIEAGSLAAGGTVTGEMLIEADPSKEIDNMEGLALREQANGEISIYMISDDNFNHLSQRTIMLEFALPASAAHAADSQPQPAAASPQ
jgi:hypothetical protein